MTENNGPKFFVLLMQFLGCCAASAWSHFVPSDETKPQSIQGWLKFNKLALLSLSIG